MRIQQASDIHLEFNRKVRFVNPCNADILMLNGDICVANYFTKSQDSPKYAIARDFLEFFETAAMSYKYVVYILGNHEHYHGVFVETADILRSVLGHLSNVFILDNSYVDIEGFRIVGGTLWTDCGQTDPAVLNYLKGYLNDFRIIDYTKTPWSRFRPIDSVYEHIKTREYFASQDHDNIIVMSHHAPSEQSIHSSYTDPMYYYGNRGYFSDLDQLILDNPQIKLWTHGHMHNNFDYMIGSTRVVCNPMGYGGENSHGFLKDNIIEV
jgi:Icc-related predicted phosphoesterase